MAGVDPEKPVSGGNTRRIVLAFVLISLPASMSSGQDPQDTPSILKRMQQQLDAQERELELLRRSNLLSSYDRGFILEAKDPEQTPFRLQVNGRMQGRYTAFAPGKSGQTDRSHFEIERGRLSFQGHIYDPALQFYYNLDADTDEDHDVKFHDFWINYEFSEAFNLHFGKSKVPSGYTWMVTSAHQRLVDRDISTTFFKADRTVGLRATGRLGDDKQHYYQAVIGNGLRSTDMRAEDVDELFVYCLIHWTDVLGSVGAGYSDLAGHEEFSLRIGQSLAYLNQNEGTNGEVLDEARWVRLGNGARLTDPGALAPGVTVNGFDHYLYTAFLVAKYNGWSANAEYYYRWLNNFDTSGGSVTGGLDASGFAVDVGTMLVPASIELMGRIAAVDTAFGDSWEYAGGVNWFLDGTHKHKLTFDVSVLDGVPAGSSSPNYELGQVGTLFRLQYQVEF